MTENVCGIGNTVGTAGILSKSLRNVDRRNRLRKIAEQTIDLKKDPYFYRNHIGVYECKLCLTIHNNEGSYLAHTQSKKHQTNIGKRKYIEAKTFLRTQDYKNEQKQVQETLKIKYIKIGRPAYKIIKEKDHITHKRKVKFEIEYSLISNGVTPQFRIMSDIEVNAEKTKENNNIIDTNDSNTMNKYHYVIFAAEPYENIAVKIPNLPIDYNPEKHFSYWDETKKIYYLTLNFK